MRKSYFFILGVLSVVALGAVVQQSANIFILNSVDDEVNLAIRTSSTHSKPIIECVKGATTVFQVNSNGGLTTPSIQSGSVVTSADGTVTNSFTTAFTAAPIVINRQTGTGTTTTNILTVTTTNFILNTGVGTQTNSWVAFGTP